MAVVEDGAKSSSVRTLVFGLPAILVSVAGVLLIGALAAHVVGDALDANGIAVVGGVAGLGLGMLLPLYLCHRLVQKIGKERVHVSAMRGTTLAVWNGLIIGGMGGLAPDHTAAVLRSSPDWLPGTGVTPLPTLAHLLADSLSPDSASTPAPVTASTPQPPAPQPPATPPLELSESEVTIEVAGDKQLTASELFKERADGVVVVKTRAKVDEAGPLGELFKMMGQSVREGHGSGFVVGTDLIVTNQHVVAGVDEMAVVTRDGRTLGPVEALVIDAEHDLALLRVPKLELPRVPLAAADPAPVIGADTYAIGAPLGLSHSLTKGIVSAHRSVQGVAFLQMQTTVAPGSSGGPLFDDHGRVVAVNTATRSPGLNLAVEVRYVHALLAAERTASAYSPWTAETEVRALTVKGVELRPTDREGIANVLQMVAGLALECAQPMPEDAQLTISVPLGIGEEAAFDGNLPEDAIACIRGRARMATSALQLSAAQLGGTAGITVHAEIVRGEAELDLTVELREEPAAEEAPAVP